MSGRIQPRKAPERTSIGRNGESKGPEVGRGFARLKDKKMAAAHGQPSVTEESYHERLAGTEALWIFIGCISLKKIFFNKDLSRNTDASTVLIF